MNSDKKDFSDKQDCEFLIRICGKHGKEMYSAIVESLGGFDDEPKIVYIEEELEKNTKIFLLTNESLRTQLIKTNEFSII